MDGVGETGDSSELVVVSSDPPTSESVVVNNNNNAQSIDIGDLEFMPLDTEETTAAAQQFEESTPLEQQSAVMQSMVSGGIDGGGVGGTEAMSMDMNQSVVVVGMTTTVDKQNVLSVLFELNDHEIDRLDETLRQKLVKNGENFVQQHDLLRSNFEKLRIENEQRFVELEAEFTECQTKLGVEAKNAHLYKLKLNENEEKLSTISRQLRILENEKETHVSDNKRLNSVNQNLEAEKRDLLSLIDKKIKENDRLNEEWKAMNSKLTLSESRVCELTYNLEEVQAKEASVALREKQYESDKKRLLNEIEWLNNQIRDKSTQMNELKSSYNQKTCELEFRLDELTAENKKLKSVADMVQAANKSLEEQNDELTGRLREARESEIQTASRASEEAESREKLMTIYQEENKSLRERLAEAAQAIADSNQMVVEVKDEYSRLLDEKKLNESLYEFKQKEQQDTIAKLEQELKNANELLSIAKRKGATVLSESDIEQLSPAAAVASRLLKGGMTLTQIYSEYVNLTETLQASRDENENLKQYLNEVIREVEEKAPLIKKQKLEYDEAVKTVNNLTSQLENAMMDYEVLKTRSEDSIKKYNSVSAENARLKQDVSDLSRQVTVLLYEVEQLRLKMLHSSTGAAAAATGVNRTIDLYQTTTTHADATLARLFNENEEEEVSSSSEAVSKSAHVFRSIEELQKQNQRLARMLNDLSDKKQSEEKLELEMKTREYNEKLSLALRELEEIRHQREKQEHLLEEIRKQRDTYKNLLNNGGGGGGNFIINNSPFSHSTPSIRQPNMLAVVQHHQTAEQQSQSSSDNALQNRELQQKLDETLSALDKLRHQFEKYQEESSNMNKSLNQELDKYRHANSELSMKAALSDSKLESAIEKCKSLNITIEKYRKEIESLKERSSKMNETVIKHEQSLQLANREVDKAREKLSELEIRLHSCTVERDLVRSNYDRLSKENELRIQDTTSRASFMSVLEGLKANMEHMARENQHNLAQKIEQLERDNLVLRKTSEQQEENHNVIVKSWQAQHDRMAQHLEKQTAEYEQSRQQLAELRGEYDKLQEKYQECDAKLHSHELIVQMSKKSNQALSHIAQLEDDKKEAQSRLSLAEKEIVSLKIQLEDSRSHAKQYKTIADTMEKTIKEASEASEKTRQVFEEQLGVLNQELARLNKQLEDLNGEKSELEARFGIDRNEYEERLSLLEQEKATLTDELETTRRQLDNTSQILKERTESRENQAARTAVLEEQLVELTERANQLENQLAEKTSELQQLSMDMSSREAELHNERTVNHETRVSYQTTEQSLRETISTLESDNQKLVSQIDVLQQELSMMGPELAILQKQSDSSSSRQPANNLNTTMDGDQSASNMLEINRYLRTQKEQLESKFETLKLDHDILVQRMAHSDNEMDSHRKQIEIYENEISQLRQSLSNKQQDADSMDTDGIQLILETSKRLKEDLDQANVENGKLSEDLRRVEDEMLNLRTALTESELKTESLTGENASMRVELTKWKERVDSFMRSSDVGPEWMRVSQELEEARERIKECENAIDQKEQWIRQRELEFKERESVFEIELEKSKSSADESNKRVNDELQSLKSQLDKEREKVNMLRKYIKIVGELNKGVEQKLGLEPLRPSSDTVGGGARKSAIEKVEEDTETSRRRIFQRIDQLQEESQQGQEEKQSLEKRAQELEEKLNEKETRLTQITNAMNNFRAKNGELSNQLNQLRGQLKECMDEKETLKQQIEQLQRKLLVVTMENEKFKNLASSAMSVHSSNVSGSASSGNVIERVASPVNRLPTTEQQQPQMSTTTTTPTIRSGTIKLPTTTSGGSGGGGMLQLRRPPAQQSIETSSTDQQASPVTPAAQIITKRTREEDTPEEADVSSSPSNAMIINLNKKSRSNLGDNSTLTPELVSESQQQQQQTVEEITVEDSPPSQDQQQSQQTATTDYSTQNTDSVEQQPDTQGSTVGGEFVDQEGNDDSVEFTDVVIGGQTASSKPDVEESTSQGGGMESQIEIEEGGSGGGVDDETSPQGVELISTENVPTTTTDQMIESNTEDTASSTTTQQQTITTTTPHQVLNLRTSTAASAFTRPLFGGGGGGGASSTSTSTTSTFGGGSSVSSHQQIPTSGSSLFQGFNSNNVQPAAQGTIISTNVNSTAPRIRRPLGPNIAAAAAAAASTNNMSGGNSGLNPMASAFTTQPNRTLFNPAQQQQQSQVADNLTSTQSFPPAHQYRLINTSGMNQQQQPQSNRFPVLSQPHQQQVNNQPLNQQQLPFSRLGGGPRAQLNNNQLQQQQQSQMTNQGGNPGQPTTNPPFGRGAGGGGGGAPGTGGGGSLARGTGRPPQF